MSRPSTSGQSHRHDFLTVQGLNSSLRPSQPSLCLNSSLYFRFQVGSMGHCSSIALGSHLRERAKISEGTAYFNGFTEYIMSIFTIIYLSSFLIFVPLIQTNIKTCPSEKESLSPGPKCFIEFASAEYCRVARLRCCTVHFAGRSLHRWRWSSREPNAPRPKGRCIELEFHSVSVHRFVG